MATPNINPRADDEGQLGESTKRWSEVAVKDLFVNGNLKDGVNTITLAALIGGGGVDQITGTIITPSTLTATANDYSPTGFATTNMIRQDIDANNREITGFVAPSAGVNRIIRINNINASGFDLRFQHNDAGSVAANRFYLRDDANKAIKPNETAAFWYDHTSSRWRPYNRVG